MNVRPSYQMGWYNGFCPAARRATIPLQREAIAQGLMGRPTRCSICGFSGSRDPAYSNRLTLHDEDYRTPLAAYAICRWCHRWVHSRFHQPEKWKRLVGRFGDANSWFGVLTLDPASQWRPFDNTYPNALPTPCPLDFASVSRAGHLY